MNPTYFYSQKVATAPIEKETDVKYIQDLPGHFSIFTQRRYLQVAYEKLVVIKRPFDALWEGGSIEWQAH